MKSARAIRTEPMTLRISPDDDARLVAAMKRLGLTSRNEALNRALAAWLADVERSDDRGAKHEVAN